MDKPQIIIHSSKSLDFTAYDVKWVPMSPKFILLGQKPNGQGILQVIKLSKGSLETVAQVR
jgi:hypothetical protein